MNLFHKYVSLSFLLVVCLAVSLQGQATLSEPLLNEYIEADEMPRPLNMREVQMKIGYPQIARDAGIDGTVVVRILVNTDGSYLRHEVLNSVHPVLDQAVEVHLSKLKFTPAQKDEQPMKFWVNIPFSFKLLDGSPNPGLEEEIEVDEMPKPLNFREVAQELTYPEAAKALGLEGKVVARILINEEGKYLKHTIIYNDHPIFAPQVEEQVRKIEFEPAMMNGKSIRFWVNVPFKFALDPKEKAGKKEPIYVKVFPNPGNEVFSLEITGKDALGEVTVEVLTSDGKRMASKQLTYEGAIFLDEFRSHSWPAGTYHVRVETAQGVFSETWIKQ